jgi:Protein of unknown function (DUF1566)
MMEQTAMGRRLWRTAGIILALGLARPTWADCNTHLRPTRPDSRYEVVAGAVPAGSEVRDKVTGLIWQRCVLGMAWQGGTCIGSAGIYGWEEALEAARTAMASAAPGAGRWRLPNVKELASLIETACTLPAINSTWFPADPGDFAWSSSPSANTPVGVWIVGFDDGRHYEGIRGYPHRVRLVRSAR